MNAPEPHPVPPKKRYAKPVLVTYGDVGTLTQSGSVTGTEGTSSATSVAKKTASDLRIKENIVRIGTHPHGFGLYLFDFKPGFGARGRQFGVIAQEVAQVIPDAVELGGDCIMRVDYARLGIRVH